MDKKILILTDKKDDFELLEEILRSKGFEIFEISSIEEIADTIFKDPFAAMIVDYDFVGNGVYHLTEAMREKSSQCCMILYGEMGLAEKVPELLQKGIYGFVPRSLLTERIYVTVLGGLENRRAFIEIMGMIEELKDVNIMLEREKEALRRKNIELDFVNRLSSKVAYGLRWDNIVPRILSAGLSQVIDLALFGIFYWTGSGWHLALHAAGNKVNKGMLEKLKTDLTDKFMTLSGERIANNHVSLHLYPSGVDVSDSCLVSLYNHRIIPLMFAGKPLGMVVILPKDRKAFNREEKDLLSTMANVLAMSLKNAQEYNKLKEMAVTDGLTGILNHKGFRDIIKSEFHRAKRYNKLLSIVMIDVDNFKQINDTFGHQAGDLVLQELARCLKRFIRNSDIVARYGGDEFAVLLPETGMEKAKMLVKRVSDRIKNHLFAWKSERLSVEISHGISTISELESEKDEEGFILRADSRLYDSKRSRNAQHLALLEA